MKVAFWSAEDGCGTTSSMAAVAGICSFAWNKKTILMQSRNQNGDLSNKLEHPLSTSEVREELPRYSLDGLDFLLWQERNHKLTESMVQESIITVAKERLYYLPQGRYSKSQERVTDSRKLMWQVICRVGQLADLIFIDCGSGENALAEYLCNCADVVVVNLLQERHSLDEFFKKRHMFRGKTIYLISQYQPCSIYNKENLNRLYRLQEDELGVIMYNPFFRHASDRGRLEQFIHRHIRCNYLNQQFGFMQELLQTAGLIVKAGGLKI